MTFTSKNWKTTGIAAVLAFAALIGFVACNSSNGGGAGIVGGGTFGSGNRGVGLSCVACTGDPVVMGYIVAFLEANGTLEELSTVSASYEAEDGGFLFHLGGGVEIWVTSDVAGSYDLNPGNASGNWGRVQGKRTDNVCPTIGTGGTFTICVNNADGVSGTWAFTGASNNCSQAQAKFTAGTFVCVPWFEIEDIVAGACDDTVDHSSEDGNCDTTEDDTQGRQLTPDATAGTGTNVFSVESSSGTGPCMPDTATGVTSIDSDTLDSTVTLRVRDNGGVAPYREATETYVVETVCP